VTVGVVVPVRGWAPYLAEALDSVLAEGTDDVVVVDDGWVAPFALPSGVRAISTARPAAGPAAARNAGVATLETDAIAFCDADDAWEPGSLAPRIAALADADLAFGRARIVGPDDRETGETWALPPAGPFADVAGLYAHNPILTSSVVMRREAFERFDESLPQAEDWDLWLRLLRGGARLTCVPEAVVRYRRHGAGLTGDVTVLAVAQRRVHERHADEVPPEVSDRALAADRAAAERGRGRRDPYRR
jgi:glycosyltransferase involved in cell wall biosynthesis